MIFLNPANALEDDPPEIRVYLECQTTMKNPSILQSEF